jgi:glycosyltransferase involved in cell wall biosynthesis
VQWRPDLVHILTLHNFIGLGPVQWLRDNGVPHLWTLMDYWPFCGNRNMLKDFVECERCAGVTASCDGDCLSGPAPSAWREIVNGSPVIAMNEHTAGIFRRNGLRADYVVECGIDTEAFRPGERGAEPTLYTSSAWAAHPVKGMHVLRKAINGSAYTVHLLTNVPRERVAEELRKADVYVFSTCYDETFGLCLTEAMASGCACIASDVAGPRAQIEDGVTGLLVPPRDAGALRAAIDRVMGDPELRATLGRNAAAHVAAEHTLDTFGRRLEAVYREVCNG